MLNTETKQRLIEFKNKTEDKQLKEDLSKALKALILLEDTDLDSVSVLSLDGVVKENQRLLAENRKLRTGTLWGSF